MTDLEKFRNKYYNDLSEYIYEFTEIDIPKCQCGMVLGIDELSVKQKTNSRGELKTDIKLTLICENNDCENKKTVRTIKTDSSGFRKRFRMEEEPLQEVYLEITNGRTTRKVNEYFDDEKTSEET